MKDTGRVHYTSVTDDEALAAVELLCRTEGIIPALESAHAIAEAIKRAPQMRADEVLVICLSGRGDKDVETIQKAMAAKEAGGDAS